jgi:hypothetical protein
MLCRLWQLTKAIPSEEAARYGDSTFGHIMMAKVICVQLVNELGYDLLFQDVGKMTLYGIICFGPVEYRTKISSVLFAVLQM